MNDDSSRQCFTVRHGVLLGASCAVLGGAMLIIERFMGRSPIQLSARLVFELVAVLLTGAVLGAVCAPLVSWIVRSKPLTPVLLLLSVTVAPVVAACMYWGSYSGKVSMLVVAVGIPTGAGIAVACVLRVLLHDALIPGHCQNCGYDLTGNVSGVCPECGTAVEATERDRPR